MKDLSPEIVQKIKTGQDATVEELMPLLRPEGIQNGIMEVDSEKCTSCGLCIKNCPFKCWEMGDEDVPKLKEDYACFSCSNCMVSCPVDAVSMVQHYRVDGGFFDTGFPAYKMPEAAKDAEGNPTEYTEVEKTILNRRSMRNFKDKPVPEPLINRILEAGRFAPSGGNTQPWKFAVVTDPSYIGQLEGVCQNINAGLYNLYANDETLGEFLNVAGKPLPIPLCDYRVITGGFRAVARKDLPIFFNAPCIIFMASNDKLTFPDMHIGICGQNMNLAALSLGLAFCWVNFGTAVNHVPEIMEKLGFDEEWRVVSTATIGYSKFNQQGMVARMSRPVTWVRSA
jgi:nitroreductase/Na+-translocating ferredoxin:NAD+ oxidoreductase RNF subunit RnfB